MYQTLHEMTKKTKIEEGYLIEKYMGYVLEHHKKPNSVHSFAKKFNFNESEFYSFFGSFTSLESQIFARFFDNTINTLKKSKDYSDFDSMNKILSFYFTFFANLTANRSYVKYSLSIDSNKLNNIKQLRLLRKKFLSFIDGLDLGITDFKNKNLDDVKDRVVNESYWIQMLVTLKFWLDDESKDFEKTDLFIEKSIAASFELTSTTPLKSVIDFGKFILKEKINMS